jgi:hypothetical protein
MKTYAKNIYLLPLLTLLSGIGAGRAAEKPAAQTEPTAVVASAEPSTLAPQSVFEIPATPKDGRNPFFPRSKSEAPVVAQKAAVVESVSFVLNGITSPPKRTAMINGRTFEVGETGEVKFSNGMRISIRCLEIRDDAAIILVADQRRELRMRAGI